MVCQSLFLICLLSLVQMAGCGSQISGKIDHNTNEDLARSTSEPSATPERLDQNRLLKQEGWQLPEPSSLILKEPRMSLRVRDTKIFRTEYTPGDDIVINATNPLITDTGSNGVERWLVLSISKFETSDGRPFCYMMRSVKVKTDETGKVTGTTTTAASLDFYDDDGDGLFETLVFGYPVIGVRPKVPSWVLEER